MKSFRENHICVICEKNSTASPWVICKPCAEFVINNWDKVGYIV